MNVLTAINVIEKDKKVIKWKGLPAVDGQDGNAEGSGNLISH